MRTNFLRNLTLAVLLWGLTGASIAQEEAPSGITTKDLDVFAWRHIGPWTFSGRITDFAVPSAQSQIYYVATASGGLWKTEDGGISFKRIRPMPRGAAGHILKRFSHITLIVSDGE